MPTTEKNNTISRREFLKFAGFSALGVTAGAAGVELIRLSYKEDGTMRLLREVQSLLRESDLEGVDYTYITTAYKNGLDSPLYIEELTSRDGILEPVVFVNKAGSAYSDTGAPTIYSKYIYDVEKKITNTNYSYVFSLGGLTDRGFEKFEIMGEGGLVCAFNWIENASKDAVRILLETSLLNPKMITPIIWMQSSGRSIPQNEIEVGMVNPNLRYPGDLPITLGKIIDRYKKFITEDLLGVESRIKLADGFTADIVPLIKSISLPKNSV